jgi:FKBP-type peptidyl-prolyl cis-trans isomerase FklB
MLSGKRVSGFVLTNPELKKKSNRTMESFDNASHTAPRNGAGRFAELARQWDNQFMTKQTLAVIGFLAVGVISCGAARAQQAPADAQPKPAATAKPATSAKSATSGQGAAASTTPKTGQAAGAKRPLTAPVPLKTQKEKASYAIGEKIGLGLKKDGVDVDTASLSRGLRDALAGSKPALTDEEAQAALTAMAAELRAKQELKLEAMSAPQKKAGAEYLAANKAKEGVVTLPSGLQYKILKEGTGPKPTAADQVVCNYRGTLIDGTEFDSSYKRNEPVTFPVNQVIKGWTEALQLMPVGSKWQIFLPSDLAYGNQGAGKEIAPGSTLIFEVELLSIAPKPEAPKTETPKTEPKVDAPKPESPKPEAKPETKPNSK